MKVLVIEDECYFRHAVVNMIESSGLDLTVCAEARDGQSGLECFRQELPEIVLADINMPLMDGLTFIAEARKLKPQSKFIILTGYDNFSYAKKAISLGVSDYMLKPITQEDLTVTLRTVITQILSENDKTTELKELQDFTRRESSHQRKRIVFDLLMGDRDYYGKRRLDEMERYGIHFRYDSFAVACLLIYGTSTLQQIADEITDELVDQAEYATVNQVCEKEGVVFYTSGVRDGKIGIILNFQSEDGWEAKITRVLDCLLDAMGQINGTILYGVGSSYLSMQKIYLSYHEAQQMCYQKQVYGQTSTFFTRGVDAAHLLWTEELRMMVSTHHRIGNLDGIEQALKEVREKAANACLNRSELLILAVEMLAPCFQYAQENHQTEVLHNYFEFLVTKLQALRQLDKIFDFVLAAYRDSICVSSTPQKKHSDTITRTLDYINKNYKRNDLVINQIAKEVYCNSSYLCCLFKKEVGVTINRYLLQMRLLNAKSLMDQGETHIQKVALGSGFADGSYFGKCFRNEFNLTPSEYIRTVQKTDE